jgi:aspartate beta-hydroxylase
MESTSNDAQVRQLLHHAAHASALGRQAEADALLRRAREEAPRHPLVMNEAARELLRAGDAARAIELLREAIARQPDDVSLWVNLAAALRTLGRRDEEMAAVLRALALEPRNVRLLLQKGSLEEMQGLRRAAAMSYRTALQLVPPGLDVPPAMQAALARARDVVAGNNAELEAFLDGRLAGLRSRHGAADQARFEQCLATMLQKQPIYRSTPSFLYFPQLPAIEFYDRSHFPWLERLEAHTEAMRSELLAVLAAGQKQLDPYVQIPSGAPLDQWRELNHSRRWGVYFFCKEGRVFDEHVARCPRTAEALREWPRWDVPGSGPSALFSILDAHTRIPAHAGVTNARLILHLPLVVPPGCGFRVGAQTREWVPGRAFVFDDTIEHEAWNDSDTPRAVLILDVWSPFLSAAERDLVREMTTAIGDFYGAANAGV